MADVLPITFANIKPHLPKVIKDIGS